MTSWGFPIWQELHLNLDGGRRGRAPRRLKCRPSVVGSLGCGGRVADQAFSPEQVSRGGQTASECARIWEEQAWRGLFVHGGSLVKKGVWPELGGGAERGPRGGSRRLHLPALSPRGP